MNKKIIWTIGHSTHSMNDFIEILNSHGIELLVDIRTIPGSKRYPHFNKENLTKVLPEKKIKYIHIKELGGRRKVKPDSKNTGWKLNSFRGYADYMETDDFKIAIKLLEEAALKFRTAFMCAEILWWRCHRSLVADYLKFNGWKVMHITGLFKITEHPYTQPAHIEEGELVYS